MILDNHQGTKIDQSGLNITRDWFRVYAVKGQNEFLPALDRSSLS
jgi:hypothetical protein